MTARPCRFPHAALLRALALGALLVAGAGCFGGPPPAGPPALHADPCAACRQNCRWKGNACNRSSRSAEACVSQGADCEMRCLKSYCPDGRTD